MLLAVVIPVYNEAALLESAVRRLLATPPPPACDRLIVLVDDGSTDGSGKILAHLGAQPGIIAVAHRRNQGKGAAVRTGFETSLARGADLVLIHDADLEYDPADHPAACAPILQGRADVVIGTRFAGPAPHGSGPIHRLVNHALTQLSNALSGLAITDMECCTKVLARRVLERITIQEDRFGLEPELVAKIARLRLPGPDGASSPARVVEVPVSYAGRSRSQGKKIGWKDGISALRCILRYSR